MSGHCTYICMELPIIMTKQQCDCGVKVDQYYGKAQIFDLVLIDILIVLIEKIIVWLLPS